MTEVDELLARLRKLPAVALDSEFKASVHARARRRLRRPARSAPFAPVASAALAVTVVLYLGWALHFASALYR
jgi:type VI protein secretion system component VasF